VASEIVLTPNPKQRVAVIEKFIELALQCSRLANFNTTMAIHTALNMTPVSRLKSSWKAVGTKSILQLKEVGGYLRSKEDIPLT